MKQPKYILTVTAPEYRLLLHSLVRFRNKLLAQQQYPDAIDDILTKLQKPKNTLCVRVSAYDML